MTETLEALGATIAGALAGAVTGYSVIRGELTVTANAAAIVKVASFLRDDERCQFWSIVDITAVDWPVRERRFDGVYHFLSARQNARVRVKVAAGVQTTYTSIIPL